MNEKNKRKELPILFGKLVAAQHYSAYYAATLKKCMANYVIPFMEKRGYEYYDLEVGEEFFSIYGMKIKHFTITSRRTVLLLKFYIEETESKRQPEKTDYLFPDQIGELSQQFIESYCKTNRSSYSTRKKIHLSS